MAAEEIIVHRQTPTHARDTTVVYTIVGGGSCGVGWGGAGCKVHGQGKGQGRRGWKLCDRARCRLAARGRSHDNATPRYPGLTGGWVARAMVAIMHKSCEERCEVVVV